MSQLSPCPQCQRHVRVSELVCPFCGGDIAETMARVPARRGASAGLSRAAILALGASVAASGAVLLGGCADDHDDGDSGAHASDGGKGDASSGDGGTLNDASTGWDGSLVAVYGAPVQRDAGAPDAGPTDAGADSGSQPQPDGGGIQPVYGAPVIRDAGFVPLYGAPVQDPARKL